jgi:CheY-like chemotaxis protein
LLDLNMPRKDGRETLREIKSHPDLKRIPVVIYTTSKDTEDIDACYNFGADSYITKPNTFESLVETMAALGEHWLGSGGAPVLAQ